MRNDFALLLVLLMLTGIMINPAFTVIGLPIFAASSRRIHPQIQSGFDLAINKSVIVNHIPYVDMDITKNGHIAPVACIGYLHDHVRCMQEQEKLCINPDTYFDFVKTNLNAAEDKIFRRIQDGCSKKVLPDMQIKENIANYIAFAKLRNNVIYHQNFVRMKTEVEAAQDKVIAEYQPRVPLRLQTLIKLYRVVKLLKNQGLVACSEVAGFAYLELLKFQKTMQTHFNIHWIRIRAMREKDRPFSHVFLILNAPDSLKQGDYQAKGNYKEFKWIAKTDKVQFDQFENIYVFDPYYNNSFFLITDEAAKSMHKAFYTSHFMVEKMLSYHDIQQTKPEYYNKFANVFKKYWEEINQDYANFISPTTEKLIDREL